MAIKWPIQGKKEEKWKILTSQKFFFFSWNWITVWFHKFSLLTRIFIVDQMVSSGSFGIMNLGHGSIVEWISIQKLDYIFSMISFSNNSSQIIIEKWESEFSRFECWSHLAKGIVFIMGFSTFDNKASFVISDIFLAIKKIKIPWNSFHKKMWI